MTIDELKQLCVSFDVPFLQMIAIPIAIIIAIQFAKITIKIVSLLFDRPNYEPTSWENITSTYDYDDDDDDDEQSEIEIPDYARRRDQNNPVIQ